MKIALFVETYVTNINGVVTHVKILKEGLESLGHTVLLVTADPSANRHYINNNILHCPAKAFKRFYNYGLANPISRKRIQLIKQFNPDIIHIHTEFGMGLTGIKSAKKLNKPLVYTLHTMYDEYLYYIAPKPLLKLVKNISHRYAKYIASHAQALTGPSKKCIEYFRDIGVSKDVTVIPNPAELNFFVPENLSEERRKWFRKKYSIPSDMMLACFVGRIGKEKSIDVL